MASKHFPCELLLRVPWWIPLSPLDVFTISPFHSLVNRFLRASCTFLWIFCGSLWYIALMADPENIRKYLRKRVLSLKVAGMCRDCGKHPHEPEKTLCGECLAKRREKSRLRYHASNSFISVLGNRPFPPLPKVCPICGHPIGLRPILDHCHVTGKIRGWVCHPCNIGMGWFKDSPDALRAAAGYLESFV